MKLILTRDARGIVVRVQLGWDEAPITSGVKHDVGTLLELPNVRVVQVTDQAFQRSVVGLEFGVGEDLELVQTVESGA